MIVSFRKQTKKLEMLLLSAPNAGIKYCTEKTKIYY